MLTNEEGAETYDNHTDLQASPFSRQSNCLSPENPNVPSSNALDSTSLGTQQLSVGDGGNESEPGEHSSGAVPVSVTSAVNDPSLLSFLLVPSSQSTGTTNVTSSIPKGEAETPPSVSLSGGGYDYNHTRRPRKSYAVEFKLNAIDHYRSGHTRAATAKLFGVHRKRIQEWINQEPTLRTIPPKRRRLTRRLMDKVNDHKGYKNENSSLSVPTTLSPHGPGAYANIQTLSNIQITSQNGSSPVSLSVHQDEPGLPVDTDEDGSTNVLHLSSFPSTSYRSNIREPPAGTQLLLSPSMDPKKHNIAVLQSLDESVVLKILDAMNLSRYKERFIEEQVDGELLVSLGEEELKELGVESSLHRLRLLKLIKGSYSAEELLKRRPVSKIYKETVFES